MRSRRIGDHAASWGAHQQPLLKEKGLHHRLKGGGVLTQGGRQGLESNRTAIVLIFEQHQQTSIRSIKTAMVDAVKAEGFGYQICVDRIRSALNAGHIPHPQA